MMGYDKTPENDGILLDLPFYEGGPIVTRDQGKPHHQDTLPVNTPTREILASGVMVMVFDGIGQYLELDNAACVDLDFMAGDYSLGCWLRWEDYSISVIVMGRYELDVGGWELYLTRTGIDSLTLRHHHAATLVAGNPRSGCYSVGWLPDTWWFMGQSRTGGGEAQHYRNGIALPMVTGGMVDPETTDRDLVIGTRYSKDTNWFRGKLWRPQIWNRVVPASEWLIMFEKERAWFGV